MKKLFSFILFFAIVSCREKIIERNLIFSGEKLVVNSILKANQSIKVFVSKSFPPNGVVQQGWNISNAKVELCENGSFKTVLQENEKGIYVTEVTPIAGNLYHLRVSATGFTTVESSQISVPLSSPKFEYKRLINVTSKYNTSIAKDQFDFTFSSPTTSTSFYFITFKTVYDGVIYTQIRYASDEQNNSRDDCYSGGSEKGVSYNLPLKAFSNKCFVNERLFRSFIVEKEKSTFDQKLNKSLVEKAGVIEIAVGEMSKEYFEYYKTSDNPDGLERIFKEPITNYSNIKNGYGLVAAANETKVIIKNP